MCFLCRHLVFNLQDLPHLFGAVPKASWNLELNSADLFIRMGGGVEVAV